MKLTKIVLISALFGLSMQAYGLEIKAISASDYDKKSDHAPSHLIDHNPATRWAASGKNNWVLVEFTQQEKISNLVINAFKSKERLLSFSIAYSLDGQTWTDIPERFQTSPLDNKQAEKFVFSTPINAKFVRINTFGTDKNNWSAINELDFNVADSLPTQQIKR